jgi:hypothetical protein
MIYKISPRPSLLKRGREKAEITHSITRRAIVFRGFLPKFEPMSSKEEENS